MFKATNHRLEKLLPDPISGDLRALPVIPKDFRIQWLTHFQVSPAQRPSGEREDLRQTEICLLLARDAS